MKAVTTGGTEKKNGLKKEERHDRDDSAYDQARRNQCRAIIPKKIAKLDSFN